MCGSCPKDGVEGVRPAETTARSSFRVPPVFVVNLEQLYAAFETGCVQHPSGVGVREHQWEAGDIIITDNLAVAHSSGAGAHDSAAENGLCFGRSAQGLC